jgi:hypothetical protein
MKWTVDHVVSVVSNFILLTTIYFLIISILKSM